MKRTLRTLVLSLFSLVWVGPGSADMVFPARLELVETEAGRFDARFNLPVQNGARLKATPVLPPACVEQTPRAESATPSEYVSSWQVSCSAEELPGQTVAVAGLLGSKTDVLLSIETLDGRRYSTVLKPARSRYVIPESPGTVQLAGNALLDGMRDTFVRVELVLLLWWTVLLGTPRRTTFAALIAGGVAYAVAGELARTGWLLLPAQLPGILTLLLVLYAAVRLADERPRESIPGLPSWLIGGAAGILYGGALAGIDPAQEWSRFEQGTASVLYSFGVTVGVVVLWLLCSEFHQVVRNIPALRDATRRRRILATWTGIAALGLLLHMVSATSVLPVLVPTAPPALFAMAMLLGARAGVELRGADPAAVGAGSMLLAGTIAAAAGFQPPFTDIAVPLLLFVLGVTLWLGMKLPARTAATISALAAFYAAAQAGLFEQENLSRPVAHMIGNAVLAALTFFLSRALLAGRGARIAGILGAGAALVLWLQAVAAWWQSSVAIDYALGLLRLPVLSLSLLALALLVRPRRSGVTEHLGVVVRKPVTHWVLATVALFCVQTGNVTVRNPWFVQAAPRPEQAQRIVSRVLTDTYKAFNLTDEEQLYRQLSESVGDELIDDLYLDSRRRLTSGVREGAEVTVEDVNVRRVGEPLKISASGDEFAYEVEWVVTARVRHLQHVHRRQNIYTGVLRIRVDGGRWKLDQIDLMSEDRAVVSGTPA